MYQHVGRCYIKDNEVNEEFDQTFSSDKIIYEVIRVIDNHALFLKDHMTRLSESLFRSGLHVSVNTVEKNVLDLIKMHPNFNKNIKIDVSKDHYRVYFMESFYPDQDKYDKGVALVSAQIERENPNVKRLNMDYKRHIEAIKGDNFEVVLVNKEGFATEGSRANILFIQKGKLYTAPLNEILVGITFKNVIQMATNMGIEVVYQAIRYDQLEEVDACFLTGTSLGVLPIHKIDTMVFNSETHEIVLDLKKAYDKEIKGEQ